jgi:hypothetical protein
MRGPSRVLFDNLCADFEMAWDAMAATDLAGRANGSFLFARQAMLLVELASTVARQDPTTRRRFSRELQAREALLFKRVPYQPHSSTRKCVPRIAPEGDPTSELIALLFDLVRHGQAHYGHQLYAPLKDGRGIGVVLLGVWKGRTIDKIRPHGVRTYEHLSCTKQRDGSLVMTLCPGTLYLDVRDASQSANVWQLDADASDYTNKRNQDLTAEALESALTDRTGPYMIFSQPSTAPQPEQEPSARSDNKN